MSQFSDDDNAITIRRIDPYLCYKVLGMSSNSAVYLAYHADIPDTPVILRLMSIVRKDAQTAIDECLQELQQIAALDTPGIVSLLDYGQAAENIYMVSRFMHGESLAKRLYHRPAITMLPSPDEVIQMTYTIARALDSIHKQGMIHGQIEPRNILFDDDGLAYLGDVGLARLLKIMFNLEASNSFTTSPYSAPELWEGHRPQPATDIYALACVVYQLFTGRLPFEANNIFEMMKQHRNDVPMPPHYLREELHENLAIVFWQALAKPPANRHHSAIRFAEEIEQVMGGLDYPATDFFTFEVD